MKQTAENSRLRYSNVTADLTASYFEPSESSFAIAIFRWYMAMAISQTSMVICQPELSGFHSLRLVICGPGRHFQFVFTNSSIHSCYAARKRLWGSRTPSRKSSNAPVCLEQIFQLSTMELIFLVSEPLRLLYEPSLGLAVWCCSER